MIFFVLLILGLLTGILAGIFGIGGGVLFTPFLFMVFSSMGIESTVSWTVGTSLFCTFTAALSSTFQQMNEHNSYFREGLMVGVFGAAGVYVGKLIVTSEFYTELIFTLFFVSILMTVAFSFYKRGTSTKKLTHSKKRIGIKESILTGSVGGAVAAMAGIGGGTVIVPALNLWYKIPLVKAVSVSSLAIVMISLSGWMQFALLSGSPRGVTDYTLGFVDFGTGLPLILGAFLGGFFGVRIGTYIKQSYLQLGFSILVCVVAIMMIWNIL